MSKRRPATPSLFDAPLNEKDVVVRPPSGGDDLRAKLIYDLAYSASLENFSTFIATELKVIFKTPLVMLRMTQGR